jgi:hypothetical protein
MDERITRRAATKRLAAAALAGITLATLNDDTEAGYCYACGACERRSLTCYQDEHGERFKYVNQYRWNSSGYCCSTLCGSYRDYAAC